MNKMLCISIKQSMCLCCDYCDISQNLLILKACTTTIIVDTFIPISLFSKMNWRRPWSMTANEVLNPVWKLLLQKNIYLLYLTPNFLPFNIIFVMNVRFVHTAACQRTSLAWHNASQLWWQLYWSMMVGVGHHGPYFLWWDTVRRGMAFCCKICSFYLHVKRMKTM